MLWVSALQYLLGHCLAPPRPASLDRAQEAHGKMNSDIPKLLTLTHLTGWLMTDLKAFCIPSHTNRLSAAEVFIILFYFIYDKRPILLHCGLTFRWTSFHWFLSWYPIALTTQRKIKVQHHNSGRRGVPFLIKRTFSPRVHTMQTVSVWLIRLRSVML